MDSGGLPLSAISRILVNVEGNLILKYEIAELCQVSNIVHISEHTRELAGVKSDSSEARIW